MEYSLPQIFENSKQIKRVFSLYPVSVEINKNRILELKFSVQNQNGEQSVLNLLLELDQLVSDKRTVINISNDDLSNITLNQKRCFIIVKKVYKKNKEQFKLAKYF